MATPTGSTAHALSAAALFCCLTSRRSWSSRSRPFHPLSSPVLPPQHVIKMTPEEDAWLVLDGQKRSKSTPERPSPSTERRRRFGSLKG